MFSSPSKVIKTVGRKTFFAWDEDTVTSILHAQEIDDDGEDIIRVSLLCPFFAVKECESIGVARGGTGADTLGYRLIRMGTHKRLVTASEQSSLVVMVSRVRVQLLVKV